MKICKLACLDGCRVCLKSNFKIVGNGPSLMDCFHNSVDSSWRHQAGRPAPEKNRMKDPPFGFLRYALNLGHKGRSPRSMIDRA
jgi:hypothetical protein